MGCVLEICSVEGERPNLTSRNDSSAVENGQYEKFGNESDNNSVHEDKQGDEGDEKNTGSETDSILKIQLHHGQTLNISTKTSSQSNGGDTKTQYHHGNEANVVTTKINIPSSFDENLRFTDSLDDVLEAVNKIWQDIKTNIKTYESTREGEEGVNKTPRKGWKVIHLFISSTFADFFAEREVLVKKVVPELQEFCEQYKIQLVECDLRWGVPKNTTSDETISICLEEINRCIEETDGQPFFLNMLGERYGWVPTHEYLSMDTRQKFDWIYPTSITHMEIIQAALRTSSQNAMFTVRKEESLEGIPKNFESSFIDSPLFAKQSLLRLKEELGEIFPKQIVEYQSKITGVENSTGMEKVSFEDLEDFASNVTDFFKKRIKAYVQETLGENTSELQIELSPKDRMEIEQEAFVQKRGQFLIGRKEELETMMHFIKNSNSDDQETDDNSRVLFLISEPGNGKSSLVANYVMKLKEQNVPCLYNFCSSVTGSTDTMIVMQRFCEEIVEILDQELPDKEILQDYDKLKLCFLAQLRLVAEKYPGFTLVLDAINQFSDDKGKSCDWLPVPSTDLNVRYVISCTPDFGQEFTRTMNKFEAICQKINLSGFDFECRQELVNALFARFNKKLDGEQLKSLISMDAAASPLWLSLACEELRVFGVFEQVTEYINKLPETISGLIGLMMERIIREDETEKVKDALYYIFFADAGLKESEIRDLLISTTTSDESEEEELTTLPMMTWIKIRRKIKLFLMNTGLGGEEHVYTFMHNSIYQAIQEDMKKQGEDTGTTMNVLVTGFHSRLAEYFLQHGNNDYRTAQAITTHLSKSKSVHKLIQFFRQDPRSKKIQDVQKSFTLAKFRCYTSIMHQPQNRKPIHMCTQCDMKKVFNSSNFRTRDLCVICGRYVAFKSDKSKAYLCQRHGGFGQSPTTKCWHCKKTLFLNQKMMFVELYLCMMCTNTQRCVALT